MKSIKILILILVFLGLLSAVMVFFKTRVSVPELIDIQNPHVEYLVDNRNLYETGKLSRSSISEEEFEAKYQSQMAALQRFIKEGYLDEREYNQQLDSFVMSYSKAYCYATKQLFALDNWPISERNFIRKRSSELLALENSNQQNVIRDNEQKSSIEEATLSIDDYEKAEKVIGGTYYSIAYAMGQIGDVRTLIRNGRLSQCRRLSAALAETPQKIGDSHFEQISSVISDLKNWQYHSLSEVLFTYDKLTKLIESYQTLAKDWYGGNHPRETSMILAEAEKERKNAADNLCYLYVEGMSSEVTLHIQSTASNQYITVSTDHPDGYELNSMSSWFREGYRDANGFSISYDANPVPSQEKKDWFNVKCGNKIVKVNLVQSPTYQKNLSINNVEIEHGVYENSHKGMRINVSYNISGYRGQQVYACSYFYYADGKAMKDTNGSYRTSDGDVAAHANIYPNSDLYYSSVTIFIPNDELHITRKGKTDFQIVVKLYCDGEWSNEKRINLTYTN